MRTTVSIFLFIGLVFYSGFANAESVIGGEVEVERDVGYITIIFTPDNPNHSAATYIYRTEGSGARTATLRITRVGHEPIILIVNSSRGLSEVSISYRYYDCERGRNRLVCAPAQAILSIWRLRLSADRRIAGAMRMPVFDFNPYLPPSSEEQ